MIKWIKKNRHSLIYTVCILGMILLLCCCSLKSILKISVVIKLKENLDFIGSCITRYPWLGTIVIILFVVLLIIHNFSINSTTMTILGVEFQLKHTEGNAKMQIKNYLSTKRSIFVFYEEYDNYYDVINSMYEILLFLRKQLGSFDKFSQTENECYQKIEGIISVLGCFLTKYQSDYKRYYETRISENREGFISFKEIQGEYFFNNEIRRDLYTLNLDMKQYADFFKINIQKWSNWYAEHGVD